MNRIATFALLGLTAGATLPLSGCAVGERINAQGQTEKQIFCGGIAMPWSACESRAASLCPTGYDLVSKEWTMSDGSEMWVRCRG